MESAVDSALQKLGVDTSNPDKMRADLLHLRDWRETAQLVRRKGIVVIVTTVLTFLISAAVLGASILWHKAGLGATVGGQ